jgi:hypothetical protein
MTSGNSRANQCHALWFGAGPNGRLEFQQKLHKSSGCWRKQLCGEKAACGAFACIAIGWIGDDQACHAAYLAFVEIAWLHAKIISPAAGARIDAPRIRPIFMGDNFDHAFASALGNRAVIAA